MSQSNFKYSKHLSTTFQFIATAIVGLVAFSTAASAATQHSQWDGQAAHSGGYEGLGLGAKYRYLFTNATGSQNNVQALAALKVWL